MKNEESKAKTFDILRFIADNAGLSTFEAIEKAYNMGVSEQQPLHGYKIDFFSLGVTSWLSTFNTDSATECFTAVQQLKKRLEGDIT